VAFALNTPIQPLLPVLLGCLRVRFREVARIGQATEVGVPLDLSCVSGF
jgi:hypothetical protein